MSTLELKFLDVGKSQHVAYRDPRNPRLPIWYPGCDRIPLNVFGSGLTEIIDNGADEATSPLCQTCELSIEEAG